MITTNYVVAETVTWFMYHRHRHAAFRFRDMLMAAQQQNLLSMEWIDETIYEAAWSYIEQYEDQELSFFDCTSFIVCRNHDVDFVFGFDSDFRTMGFDLRPGVA